LGARRLAAPHLGARARHHCDAPEDDHGVLDEDRVRAVVCGRRLNGLPARVLERGHVALPLCARTAAVDGHSFDVGDDALAETGARSPDERLQRLTYRRSAKTLALP